MCVGKWSAYKSEFFFKKNDKLKTRYFKKGSGRARGLDNSAFTSLACSTAEHLR